MVPGVAGAPNADPCCVDFRHRFQKRDRPPPIRNLAPRVDIVANGAIAGPKVSMVMHEHDQTGLGKGAGEALEPMLLYPRIAMGDGLSRCEPPSRTCASMAL
jgi:hypothetical protein